MKCPYLIFVGEVRAQIGIRESYKVLSRSAGGASQARLAARHLN